MKKRIALVVGHTAKSPGAKNPANENRDHAINEFEFNEQLAKFIEAKNFINAEIVIVYRQRYDELSKDINSFNPDLIICLHCNAFNTEVSGTEVLYYYKSPRSKRMAIIFQKHLVDYLGLPNRGIKPKQVEDRGGPVLKYTLAPCIIAEPFFIDNDNDFAVGSKDMDALAGAYSKAICESIEKV